MGECLMGIYVVENRTEIKVGEKDVVMVVAETLQGEENEVSLLLAEFSEEDLDKAGFPFVINGKPIEEMAQVSISCTDEEQVDKIIRMLEIQKETIREMKKEQGLKQLAKELERD